MFSEENFIADCVAFLGSNDYEDYEDVKFDIGEYVDANLPSNLYSPSQINSLCPRILAAYMESDHELVDVNIEDEEDDILFRSVEIWLAAAANDAMLAGG
jgi:hypothetical protein